MDGKALAERVRAEVAEEVRELGELGLATCSSATIRPPTSTSSASTRPREVGIVTRDSRLPSETSEDELLELVAELNGDDAIDGILVQLPLPGPHRRGARHPRGRADQGRRRLPPVQRRAPLPRQPDACAGYAARRHAAARGVRRRAARGRERRRGRPQQHRRQADGDDAAPRARDGHHLPLADARPRRADAPGGRARRRRRPVRRGRPRTASSPAQR